MVKATEIFADGDSLLSYLDAVVQKAANLGIYIIIDLHGAPGGQEEDVFTGQNAKPAGFFNQHNFGRAKKWLAWMTDRIHTNSVYCSMGIIEVLNEPVSRHNKDNRYPAPGQDPGLIYQFYPAALKAVSDTEAMLNVSDDQKLHMQFISSKWDSGYPLSTSAIADDALVVFDDHNYIGFALGDQKGDPY